MGLFSNLLGRPAQNAAPGLRWFFALNEESPGFWEYANLIQVAVHTARRFTTLRPVCLYEGTENALTAWLAAAGVTVLHRRSFLHAWVPDLSPIARGAYLRLEIPAVCREQGWTDDYVLYTDCDVMFRGDVAPLLAPLRPRFFAVAPEHDQADLARFNSGVMLLHVPAFAAEMPALQETIRAHLRTCVQPPYDQAALQLHFAGRVDPLPLELNWKPYWGAHATAPILHFHGPKPAHQFLVLNRRAPADLLALANPAYFAACRAWEDELFAALAAQPWTHTPVTGSLAPGFAGFDSVAGLGDPERAQPEALLGESRWGLAPRTDLTFTAAPGERLRLELAVRAERPGQALSVALDDREIAHAALVRMDDTYPLVLDLDVAPGPHRLAITFARHFQQPPDPRSLTARFFTLRLTRHPAAAA